MAYPTAYPTNSIAPSAVARLTMDLDGLRQTINNIERNIQNAEYDDNMIRQLALIEETRQRMDIERRLTTMNPEERLDALQLLYSITPRQIMEPTTENVNTEPSEEALEDDEVNPNASQRSESVVPIIRTSFGRPARLEYNNTTISSQYSERSHSHFNTTSTTLPEKKTCPICGSCVLLQGFRAHLKTAKHIQAMRNVQLPEILNSRIRAAETTGGIGAGDEVRNTEMTALRRV